MATRSITEGRSASSRITSAAPIESASSASSSGRSPGAIAAIATRIVRRQLLAPSLSPF
ncbi:MAG TPA: hypothetical protein VFN37_07760 [Candidatus Baltobacteraceae bacterium]|nr:hypothetical protein [Candidatus Baltobacteraceae bacterium]